MRKQDYSTLALIIRTATNGLRDKRDDQLAIGIGAISSDLGDKTFHDAYDSVKRLEASISHIQNIGRSCACQLSVDQKSFLRECGIFSGSVFD